MVFSEVALERQARSPSVRRTDVCQGDTEGQSHLPYAGSSALCLEGPGPAGTSSSPQSLGWHPCQRRQEVMLWANRKTWESTLEKAAHCGREQCSERRLGAREGDALSAGSRKGDLRGLGAGRRKKKDLPRTGN